VSHCFNILIIEDEILIAQDLKELLEEFGYEKVYRAKNFQEAIKIFDANSIDLVLLDINLHDIISGIDIAAYINKHHCIPFIYITSYADKGTIDEAKHTHPGGFLLKPYTKDQLFAKIEITLFNHMQGQGEKLSVEKEAIKSADKDIDLVFSNHLIIKENYHFIKIPFTNILWLESNKNYLHVITEVKKHLVRCSLKKMMDQLPASNFLKCHKCFVINLHHVDAFKTDHVMIKGNEIPISRHIHNDVLSILRGTVVH